MAEATGIEWSMSTWNPWIGCTHLSEGCRNCYMFTEQRRYGNDPTIVTRTKTWGDPIKWNRQAAIEGLKRLVFTCSWSDFFHPAANEWREEAWDVIRRTPNLVYQILTKRADKIADRLPRDWGDGYPNVWLGVSAEDQKTADARIPFLLKTPTACRFLSLEPLLGPIDLKQLPNLLGVGEGQRYLDALKGTAWVVSGPDYYDVCSINGWIDWVIVGGESGPDARPMHPAWVRDIRDQCVESGVAFFFKQWGAYEHSSNEFRDFEHWVNKARGWISGMATPVVCVDTLGRICRDGCDMARARDEGTFPLSIAVRVGKKSAGRLLDGREWSEMPAFEMEASA